MLWVAWAAHGVPGQGRNASGGYDWRGGSPRKIALHAAGHACLGRVARQGGGRYEEVRVIWRNESATSSTTNKAAGGGRRVVQGEGCREYNRGKLCGRCNKASNAG